jgi:hypothetical protein
VKPSILHRRGTKTALMLALLTPGVSVAVPAGASAAGEPKGNSDVVIVLAKDTSLDLLAPALAAGGGTAVEWHHRTGEWRGGFYSLGIPAEIQLKNYRAAYADRFGGGEPSPFAVRVRGVEQALLGALATAGIALQGAHEVPSVATVFVDEPEDGGLVAIQPQVAPTSVMSTTPWQPDYGKVELFDDTGVDYRSGNLGLTNEEARGVTQSIVWDHDNVGGLFDSEWAYEHDFKLYNPNNLDLPQGADQVFCPNYQRADFWAYKNDGIEWDSTLPDGYLDTGLSDACDYHDLTIGTYHPTKLQGGIEYRIGMTVAQGDVDQSAYQLRGETLDRDCDVNPWCVGIGGGRESGDLLVGIERGVAPGCRTWVPNLSEPCALWSDDFNRSNRILGGDNGWEAIMGEVQIETDAARWMSYGADNFGGWYGSPTVAQRRFDPVSTDVVSVSVDAAVETGKTASGTASIFLFVGGFGTYSQFPNEYDDGVYLQITDSGNLYLEQYNGLSSYQHYSPSTDGIADFRDAPGVIHNFRLAYDPAASTAQAYLDDVLIMTLATGGPMGQLIGLAVDPEDRYAAQFGDFYFREWLVDRFAIS